MLPLVAAAIACISPLAYGAVPNDGKPDQAALAKALAEAHAKRAAVCLPAGVFELGRTDDRASLVIDRGPVTLRGAGAATVLRMTGDGRKGDWRGLELRGGARDVVIEELTIDSLGTFNTEEQTHLIQLSAGVRKVVLREVHLGPMRRPEQKIGEGSGGDCVRLLGEGDRMIEDVVIRDSTFVDCDRSGVSLQRGLRRISITRSSFRGTGDAAVDFEPTAPGPIERVTLSELEIEQAAGSQASWAMTIGGHGESVATGVNVTDCKLRGGGIGLLNVGEVLVLGNEITHGSSAAATIALRRRAGLVRLERNVIVRPAAAPPGALIEAQHNNGLTPTALRISGNHLRQETAAPLVSTTSLAELEVSKNLLEYQAQDTRQFIIDTHAVAADAGKIRVLDNTIRGATAAAALRLDARKRAVSGVELRGNVAESLGESVACEMQQGGRISEVATSDNVLGTTRSRCMLAPQAASERAASPPASSPR